MDAFATRYAARVSMQTGVDRLAISDLGCRLAVVI
jgi:hypothetical protein